MTPHPTREAPHSHKPGHTVAAGPVRSEDSLGGTHSHTVAAEVGGRAIPVSLVDEREAGLRAGPLAARLPHPHSAEGRNLRRWLVQVLITETLIHQEATTLHLDPAPSDPNPAASNLDPAASPLRPAASGLHPAASGLHPAASGLHPAALGSASALSGSVSVGHDARPARLTLTDALRTGGVVAAVTTSMPLARRLRAAVTAGVTVPDSEVRAYYTRNLDRYTHQETRHVTRLPNPEPPPVPPPGGGAG
ncbi:DUF7158 domain-containing protein, partial [Sphaerisporangium corydalis]|uniref:DUF7158 domain-containing protein n=1 Tax=Sphaerisporangium corydalis TaxID=1441875 RepID=UPI0021D010D6